MKILYSTVSLRALNYRFAFIDRIGFSLRVQSIFISFLTLVLGKNPEIIFIIHDKVNTFFKFYLEESPDHPLGM